MEPQLLVIESFSQNSLVFVQNANYLIENLTEVFQNNFFVPFYAIFLIFLFKLARG